MLKNKARKVTTKVPVNAFLSAVQSHNTTTANGAISNSTSGSALVDQFAKAGAHRNRGEMDVMADMGAALAEDKSLAYRLVFYLRMITRKIVGFKKTETVQRGQGARDESLKRMAYLAKFDSKSFYNNLWLMPLVGVWKDLWNPILIHILDRTKVYDLVMMGIDEPAMTDLVAKYLPRIRSKSNTYNDRHRELNKWARGFCYHAGWTEEQYRIFKSTGKAHDFQRQITKKYYDQINWSLVPGKALFNFTQVKDKKGQTFIERHNLEASYNAWLDTQPTAKFTGYVYELGDKVLKTGSITQKKTLDKQFDGLIELAKKDTGGIRENVWVAVDTSGSMMSPVANGGTTAINVAKSLGVYFSSLNEGAFHKQIITFSARSTVKQLRGAFTEMYIQTQTGECPANTDFMSVINEIIRVKRDNPLVPLKDFPTTLLVVSDMQFDGSGSAYKTNYEVAKHKLSTFFPKKWVDDFKFIWWQVNAQSEDQPATVNDAGVTLISGFDGAVVTLILGGQEKVKDDITGKVRALNAQEQMEKALSQEILMQVKI